MRRRQIALRARVAGLLALGLAGYGTTANANELVYEALLTGVQEAPPVSTAGRGTAVARLNPQTNALSYNVSFERLTTAATGAHIHGPAPAGQNAGVLFPLTGNLAAPPLTGQATLTPEQVRQLAAGLMYVNIHTGQNPSGEIRGQLRLQ